jgi:hypothetical protein
LGQTSDDKLVVSLVDAREQRDDAYRAIGRYTVEFSMLVAGMREIMAGRITHEKQERGLIDLAFGALTAKQVADPFFAICRAGAELDDGELAIEKRLRKQVIEEIEERNKIMHGDWLVARWTREDLEAPTAALVRVKASNIEEPFKQENFTASQIDEICDRVIGLRNVVWEFGTICTEQWDHDPARGRPKERVRDALQIVDGTVVYRPGDRRVPWPPA